MLAYVSVRAEWVDLHNVEVTSALQLVVAVVISYLLGHLTYGVSRFLEGAVPWGYSASSTARELFVSRHPQAKHRRYVYAHFGVVRGVIARHMPESLLEVGRLHAVGLMLRGSVPALILGALVAAFEIFAGPNTVFAVSTMLLLAAAAAAAAAQGRRHRLWANLLALEVAYGIPNIDELIDNGQHTTG